MTMLLSAQIKAQILRILLAAQGEPVPGTTLRDGLRMSFPHVAFTEADLCSKMAECEAENWISGTADPLLGVLWGLTAKGTLRAQALRPQ